MTFKTAIVAPVFFVFLAGGAHVWSAETIIRKREKNLSGEVSSVTKTEVQVKVKTPKEDTIKVPANDIATIEWSGEPPECKVARSDENGGRYQKAIDGYQKALQSNKASNAFLKTDLEFGIVRAAAKMALNDPARLDEAIKGLEEFRRKNGDFYRFYDTLNFLGQLHEKKKDTVKAKPAFEALGKAPWKDYQMTARIALGRLALTDNKIDEAASEYDAVVGMQADGPAEESLRQEAVLGKARVLIGQKNFDAALKLLDEVIAKAPGDDAHVNAEAYLRKGDCLREQGNDKDALLAYLVVDVLFSSERAYHPEALYRLSSLWEKVGNKGRAEEARDRLKSDYESNDWAKQLKTPAAGA
jgi:tetratricopeptide (TPR) repeat protein